MSTAFEDSANISGIDCLPQCAIQFIFSGKRLAEYTFGCVFITQCEINIPDAIEGYQATFFDGIRTFSLSLYQIQCLKMTFGGFRQYTDTPVVGSQIIQRFHDFKCVIHLRGYFQPILMVLDGFFKKGVFTIDFS